ncbi:MAG: hypothetical protein P8L45_07355 [Longimicrobiales bacterium]|nr:hypothetical protein [Longimicrobiales bacterium]
MTTSIHARVLRRAGCGARSSLVPLLIATLSACGGAVPDDAPTADARSDRERDPQLVFWSSLESLCGQAFEGRVTESVPPDPSFEAVTLVMHVRSCDLAEIRIPFHVGEDRSRTWVITPTSVGLRLKHDHRHEDGSEDEVTQYGGDTRGQGASMAQDFLADALTASLVPEAATNVWTVEVRPGEVFAYALRREGTDRRFRVEFDLAQPVDSPPPPWGG